MNTSKLSDDWIALHYLEENERSESSLFYAYDKLDELCEEQPYEALKLIVEIVNRDPSDNILANIGAGPIEDLLVRHGSLIVDELIKISKENELIKKAVSNVWENSIETDVWLKVRRICD